jgi:glycosyltransferase involved in cell wall biosynthesis
MKILFLQPGYAHYRKKLFKILSESYDILFLFIRSNRTYPDNSQPPDIDYCYVDNKFKIEFFGIIYYLLKEKPEVVITSGTTSTRTLVSYLYASIYGKKLIVWVLEWRKLRGTSKRKKLIVNIKDYIRRWIVKECDAVVVGGTAAYQNMRFYGKSRSEIFMANQSTKDLSMKKETEKKEFEASKKYVFLYLGRIIQLKGLDILLKAFYLLRKERNDVSLLVGGDGPFKGYCTELSEHIGLEDVNFLGNVKTDNLPEIYKRGSVFVLPSYFCKNRYEAWGLVINEAMSMGLPIITTDAVGASFDMVVNEKNGLIVKENSVYELYFAMKKILTMDLEEMRKSSRRIYDEKNSYFKMASGFDKAIKHVIGKGI